MKAPSFNLVREPWIPVEDQSGHLREVSLSTLFSESDNLTRIVDQSPAVAAALYRLVIAIATRAFALESNDEWEEAWEEGGIGDTVGAYLTQHDDRFDLFCSRAPFYQVLDMPENCRPFPWTKLALELPPNSSKLLFDHTSTADPPKAEPAAVARALVAAQAFLVGAGKSCLGYTSNSPLTAALCVVPEGRTLTETVLANIQSGSSNEDAPVWERPPLTAADIEAQDSAVWNGPVSRLTWQARAVRLLPWDETGTVQWIHFAMGFKTPTIDGDRDPWVPYRVTKDGARIPKKLDLERMVWREFHAMLNASADGEKDTVQVLTRLSLLSNSDRPPPESWTILVAGVHADKASIKAWRQERWRVPESLVSDDQRRYHLSSAAEEAEEFGKRVDSAAWFTAAELLGGADKANRGDIRQLADSLPAGSSYWTFLERRFQGYLNALGGDIEEARISWRRDIAQAVRIAARATHAAIGRDSVALKAWALGKPRFDRLAAGAVAKDQRFEGEKQEAIVT